MLMAGRASMTPRAGYYPDSWTATRQDRDDGSPSRHGPYQGAANSPPSRSQEDPRFNPYPQASSRSSLQYPNQQYPPGYLAQDQGIEEATYSGRELPRNTARPFVTYDQPFERHAYQTSLSDPYRSPPFESPQGSMRPPPSFGHSESFPEPHLHRRPSSVQSYEPLEPRARISPTHSLWGTEYTHDHPDNLSDHSIPLAGRASTHGGECSKSGHGSHHNSSQQKPHHTQKRSNRDEFDGPTQYLPRPPSSTFTATERDLPTVPVTLDVREQDSVLSEVNTRLSQCAFNFIAKYNFPIPLEAGKRRVESPSDREWTEWAHLLKRLATKRRIPARLLYEGQIKQMVTVLENSLEMRHASAHLSRPPKDDWNVLQLVSAGVQVAKLLKDGETMSVLEALYRKTEGVMSQRKGKGGGGGSGSGIWGNR